MMKICATKVFRFARYQMGDKNTWNAAAIFLLISVVSVTSLMAANAQGNNSAAQTSTRGQAAATTSQTSPVDKGSIGVVLLNTSAAGHGVKVAYAVKGGPADQAGLRAGDLITAVDGTPVNKPEELVKSIFSHSPGTTIAISYLRHGKPKQTPVIVPVPLP